MSKLYQNKLTILVLMVSFLFFIQTVQAEQTPVPIKVSDIVKDGAWFANQVSAFARNDPQYAIALSQQALEYFKNNSEPQHHAKVLNELSYAYYFLARYTESMQQAKQAEIFAERNNLLSSVARAKNLQANVLQEIGAFQHAVDLYLQAAQIYRELHEYRKFSRLFHNIANTYFAAEQYDAALEFYLKSGEFIEKDIDKARYNLGLANTYGQKNQSELAIEHFKKADLYYRKNSDQIGQELALNGLAMELSKNNKDEEAITLFNRALASAEKSSRRFHIANVTLAKIDSLIKLNRLNEALYLTDAVLKQAEARGNKPDQVTAYKAKHIIHEKRYDYHNSLIALKKAIAIEKSFKDEQAKTQLAVMQGLLEVETKDHQIELLNTKNSLQILEMKNQRVISFSIVGFSLFLLSVFAFLIYRKTQLKMLEKQIKVNQQLEELNELKTQLLANTSHELRTPLNGIIGMTQLLLSDDETTMNKENIEQVTIIEKCGERLLSLIEDILDLSQLQAKKLKLHKTHFELKPLLNEVCALLENMAVKKGLNLKYEITPENITLFADQKRMHQVLNNLVGNAIKFSQSGSILISAKEHNKNTKISVKDQGEGIPKEDLDLIFEPFGQVNASSNRVNQGSGLGLAITKELLSLHQSNIIVNSQAGQGAEFVFEVASGKNNNQSD